MRVLVTGASGFIGAHVLAAVQRAGHTVLATSRTPVAGVPWVRWDLTDGVLTPAPEVDAVVHVAGIADDGGPPTRTWSVNLGGTRAVRATFPHTRMVHISSASVYDPFVPGVRSREDEAPVRRYVNAYGASKAAAEVSLAGHPDLVVLRPHAVYGPGDRTLLPRVEGALRGRVLVLPDGGDHPTTLTSVALLARAAVAALSGPTGVYNVGDTEPVGIRDALTEVLARRGHGRVRVLGLPTRLVWPLADVLELAGSAVGRTPRLTRYALSHLGMERTLDLTRLRDVLGVEPSPTSFGGAQDW